MPLLQLEITDQALTSIEREALKRNLTVADIVREIVFDRLQMVVEINRRPTDVDPLADAVRQAREAYQEALRPKITITTSANDPRTP